MSSPAAVPVEDLVAWSVEVDDPGDLLSWLPAGDAFAFLRGGDGLVGWGEATRLPATQPRTGSQLATEVGQLLNAMTVRDDVGLPGSGPVAIASLTFDPAAGGSVVVVPKVVMGRRQGRSWLTLVTPPGTVAVPTLRRRPVKAATAPLARLGEVSESEQHYASAVSRAIAAIEQGRLNKVVLARAIQATADTALDGRSVASRLAQRFPGCFTYLCDGLVGASPELLIRRQGRHAESLVLAGTVRRGSSPAEDTALEESLLTSAKDAEEHRWAADSVSATLRQVSAEVVVDDRPQLLRLANVSHLATPVEAWLPEPAPSALALATTLHPTAAVGGVPTDDALAMIRAVEAQPRERYAGPVGWVDGRGDGEFALALRCAQLDGPTATLWAGAGIVYNSDPAAEVAETTAKFDAVLSALT